ncbi:hypothetical protein BDZ91DRAFT_737206 [Kalaharituber pfeilii]|nr:hypothetical protein BDZ91DRAFT_737206 [Kalaharituber pfeilii]
MHCTLNYHVPLPYFRSCTLYCTLSNYFTLLAFLRFLLLFYFLGITIEKALVRRFSFFYFTLRRLEL